MCDLLPTSFEMWYWWVRKILFFLDTPQLFLWSALARDVMAFAGWTHLVVDEDKHNMRLVLLWDSWSVVLTVPTTVLHRGLLCRHRVQYEQNAQHGERSSSRRMRRAPHLYGSPAGSSSEMSTNHKQGDGQMAGQSECPRGSHPTAIWLADTKEAQPSVNLSSKLYSLVGPNDHLKHCLLE